MRGCILLIFTGILAGAHAYAGTKSCDLECKDEAKAIAADLHQASSKSCFINEDLSYTRDPALGARMVKFQFARSCELSAPSSIRDEDQTKLKDFIRLSYEAAGINHEKKDFEKTCFTEHSVLEMKAGDVLEFGRQKVIVDSVGKSLSSVSGPVPCEDLVSDPTRIDLGVIFLSRENGIRNIVRGRLSPAMGDESANNPWVTRILDAAQRECKVKQHKRGLASVLSRELVVKRFNPHKPGCLRDDFMPFRMDGGVCAKCCLIQNAGVAP